MTSVPRAWALQCLALLAAAPAAIADEDPTGLTIVVDLVVEDTKGRPVTDLTAGDFVVAQGNVRQKIASLAAKSQPGHYELRYAPDSGKVGRVTVQLLRLGTRVRGVDGPAIKPRVVLPRSSLATELAQVLETRPDADFPSLVGALRFESAADGVHYTLALEVPLGALKLLEGPTRYGGRVQIYARLSDAQGRITREFDVERSLAPAGSARAAVQRMVWTGQVHLRSGRYMLDDPFMLGGQPIMPTLELKTSAAPGVKVEFFAIVYPDRTSPEPVTLTLEVVRGGSVVATVPLSLPAPDTRGEIRYAAGLTTRNLSPAEYRLRLLARQGAAQASEEAAFTVSADSDVAPVRVGVAARASASGTPQVGDLEGSRSSRDRAIVCW